MRQWGCLGVLVQIGAFLSLCIFQASDVLRGMDQEKVFFFSSSWCDVLKIIPHVGFLHHGMEHLQPIGTFRMAGARAVICVPPILDNAGSSGWMRHFFHYPANTRLITIFLGPVIRIIAVDNLEFTPFGGILNR